MARSASGRRSPSLWPKTREQRCWVHKTANILNKLPKSQQPKLVEGAQKTWRRLDGHNLLPKIIRGVKFTDGCEVIAKPGDLQSQTAAA